MKDLWKKFENEDIVLYSPFDWSEIILKVGSEEHKKFINEPFNQAILSRGEEIKSLYTDIHHSIAKQLQSNAKSVSDIEIISPVIPDPSGKFLLFTIYGNNKETFRITIENVKSNNDSAS